MPQGRDIHSRTSKNAVAIHSFDIEGGAEPDRPCLRQDGLSSAIRSSEPLKAYSRPCSALSKSAIAGRKRRVEDIRLPSPIRHRCGYLQSWARHKPCTQIHSKCESELQISRDAFWADEVRSRGAECRWVDVWRAPDPAPTASAAHQHITCAHFISRVCRFIWRARDFVRVL